MPQFGIYYRKNWDSDQKNAQSQKNSPMSQGRLAFLTVTSLSCSLCMAKVYTATAKKDMQIFWSVFWRRFSVYPIAQKLTQCLAPNKLSKSLINIYRLNVMGKIFYSPILIFFLPLPLKSHLAFFTFKTILQDLKLKSFIFYFAD